MEAVAAPEYHSDPEFRICRLPEWRARLYKFLSLNIWGGLPGTWQRRLSAVYARHYSRPYSKWIIRPYMLMNYRDGDYLKKFKPPGDKEAFESFQDFFIREYRQLPRNEQDTVWPCEGLVCEQDAVEALESVRVKNDIRSVDTIFGLPKNHIPATHSFTNIFLHNKNYHRIHAPVSGKVERIQHIPGELIVLRPWFYRQNPSLPAFRNERYNMDITDEKGRTWYLSIVGGPAVGTIAIPSSIQVGQPVRKLQELAVFYLGSTCCIAAPIPPRFHKTNSFVEVGATY